MADAAAVEGRVVVIGAGCVVRRLKKDARGADVRGIVRAATTFAVGRTVYESFMWWPMALPTPYTSTTGFPRRVSDAVGVGLMWSELRRRDERSCSA
jgi:hypothetical protein